MPSLEVHGNYLVNYDDQSRHGVDYLFNLSYEGAKAVFDKATATGKAEFDYDGSGYKLKSDGDTFTLTKEH